jgi:thioredoxin reductase/NAD-dependent dihydropyrimidine dehydrogenase PreA subunit
LIGWFKRYARWLHTGWPAGTVERLPEVRRDGSTAVPGVYVAGDLTGVPLLKFALDSGARVARTVAADPTLRSTSVPEGACDLAIVGAGVAGVAAAVEARRLGLSVTIFEAAEPFFTLVNFPKRKPIYTYPHAFQPAGALQVTADVKEDLVAELRAQAAAAGVSPVPARAERVERAGPGLSVKLADGSSVPARRVLIAIGRSGNFRRLDVPGEDLDKVTNRLHDPRDFAGRRALVVGGGDSALECAIALTLAGADVTLVHRGATLARPKPDNVARLERLIADPTADVAIEHPTSELVTTPASSAMRSGAPGRLALRLGTRVRAIAERSVGLEGADGRRETIDNDAVFAMIGRDAPLDTFRRSGVPIAGEMTAGRWTALSLFLVFCAWLYNWKSYGSAWEWWQKRQWFPANLPDLFAAAGGSWSQAAHDPRNLIGTLAISASGPAFYYTLAYSIVVVIFGIRRIRRRRTPYVTAQTLTLMAVQVFPLFLIPEILLPQLDAHGWLPRGIADALFPVVNYGHGREFWRAYGLVLAWPLNVYNLFTDQPLGWWIAISVVQTCVLIPLAVNFFGKGAYCGWICSCGALAETLGDTHRHKMPHGPRWNRLNLAGQGVLAIAVLLLLIRIAGWLIPGRDWIDEHFYVLFESRYKWTVDVFLAGVLGYGVYFWYSGRFWCRFFCPLAALMHVYARFGRFAIVADKKKCISCAQCTTVCHQGIDVMSFANKGLLMRDPECVRCSACVETCPTGVLSFGQVARSGEIIRLDSLLASPVQRREGAERAARQG